MIRIGWDKRLNDFRQEVTLIGNRARKYSYKSKELQKQAECCKVQFLLSKLEEKRNFLASSRGFTSFSKNKQALSCILKIAAVSVLAGIVAKDKWVSVNTGLSGFTTTLRQLGETDWAVCLERQLEVAPRDKTTPGDIWHTWDSVKSALTELEQRAQNGTLLGNLDAVIAELRRSERLEAIRRRIYYIVPKIDYLAVDRQGTGSNCLRIPEVLSGAVNSKLPSTKDTSMKNEFLLE